MAYISQDTKKKLAPAIKKVLAKYGMKGTLATNNNSTLIVNLRSGDLDVIGNMMENRVARPGWEDDNPNRPEYLDVNTYHVESHYSGKVKEFLLELIKAMKGEDWFDNSDIMSDYFNIAYYLDIRVGRWNKPFILNK